MVDVELENATVAILLNRAAIVLDELLELWDNPHDDNPDRLPPGYFDDSCSDDFDWYMGYRDSDMLIEMTMNQEGSPKVHVVINGRTEFTAGETYCYTDSQMQLVVHEAFWTLYRKLQGLE